MVIEFSKIIEHLLDTETPLKPAVLYHLSKLDSKELEQLGAAWPSIPAERRQKLTRSLVEIAELNFEVDFEPIFWWGLEDAVPQVRAAAVDGLWENKTLSLMDKLLHMLQNDPSDQVRAAAAMALGRFLLLSELEELPPGRCQPVYEALCQVISENSNDLQVRRRALESISYVSNDQVIDFIQAAHQHPEEKMRVSAVFGMGRSADSRWINVLIGELFSINPEMRYEAARACGELEARAAVSRLAELIDDPDREVQAATLWALGQIGGEEARRVLETCCEEEDEFISRAAEAALEHLEFMYSELQFPFHAFDEPDDLETDAFI
jgi:HEAT repeat protein